MVIPGNLQIEKKPAWYALRVFFRREKDVKNRLKSQSIDAWIPLLKKVRSYKTKTREVHLPLIPQYVFVNCTPQDFSKVRKVPGVIEFIKPSGYIQAIEAEEIEILRKIVGQATEAVLQEERLQKGEAVELISGELTGLKGVLVEYKGKKWVSVEFKFLEQPLLMDVPVSALQKI